MSRQTVFLGLALAVCSLVVSAVTGQETEPDAVGYSSGVHIVRPGENLRKITRNYLGSELAWEQNWRLNSGIEDPDFLTPGQRLRVLVRTADSVPSAKVVSLSGRVEGRPAPIDWNPAKSEDLVLESDGLRTFARSSTALKFHDGTRLVMTEDSIVFLKRAGKTLQGIETRSVEIVEGQADLATSAGWSRSADIEIVIGEARAQPQPGADGVMEARLRKTDLGSAQLMVYEGESRLAAGGEVVAVKQGMGTSVPEGGSPARPEELLPAPVLRAPDVGAEAELGSLEFSWSAVAGAASYTVEACTDAACEQLVLRALGEPGPSWSVDELPLGDHYWRVTAVSPSGLDGYATGTRAVTVAPRRAEFEAPTATLEVKGVSVQRAQRVYFDRNARVLASVEDPSGVGEWHPVIDRQAAQPGDLEGDWATGEHHVMVMAEDRLGNRGRTGSVSFVVDAQGPEIQSRIGGGNMLEAVAGYTELTSPKAHGWRARGARRNARRVRNHRPPRWTLLGWGNDRVDGSTTFEQPDRVRGLYRNYRSLRLTGESPFVVILAAGIAPEGAVERGTHSGNFLFVRAVDEMAGVAELTVRTAGSSDAGYWLEATARDRLGNLSRARWDFDTGRRRQFRETLSVGR